jgi:hypothetical protein
MKIRKHGRNEYEILNLAKKDNLEIVESTFRSAGWLSRFRSED